MSLKSEGLTQLEVTKLRKGKIVAIIKLSLFIPGKNERQKRLNTLINLVALEICKHRNNYIFKSTSPIVSLECGR